MLEKEVNWTYWKENIGTDGFVDKLKTNYDLLRKEEYDVEKIAVTVATSSSKDLDDIVKIRYFIL